MSGMRSTSIRRSAGVNAACQAFLDEIGSWVRDCIEAFGDQPPTDGHDQGTFTTGWEPYIQARGDPSAVGFIKELRDKIARHFSDSGKWRHGYWTMQEAHHGTEHYELFLGSLWRLDPDDPETIRQVVDAAEHLGNWSADVPDWFDWDRGIYKSMFFGVEGVQIKDRVGLNVPDHFRCINICLLAHQMTGDSRYLELSALYGGNWADAILEGDHLPIALTNAGGVYALEGETLAAYQSFAGQAGRLNEHVNRAENLLASGAINALLDLGSLTGGGRFREAAERLLDTLATQLADPDAGAAADALMSYRRRTGDGRYDRSISDAAAKLDPAGIGELSIEPEPKRDARPSGIGKRQDMPNWFEDSAPRQCNPILLAAASEISGGEDLATNAVDLARAYFALARECYPPGRRHGCSARSVSAICRGHGRENHAGVTTAVLAPLISRFAAGAPA